MSINWFQLTVAEVMVIVLLTMLLASLAFIAAPFILWIRTNRYQDIYDVIKFHEENKKIYALNDKCLTDLKDMMVSVVKKVDEMERVMVSRENPTRIYETVSKILDRLDSMEKK